MARIQVGPEEWREGTGSRGVEDVELTWGRVGLSHVLGTVERGAHLGVPAYFGDTHGTCVFLQPAEARLL